MYNAQSSSASRLGRSGLFGASALEVGWAEKRHKRIPPFDLSPSTTSLKPLEALESVCEITVVLQLNGMSLSYTV